MKWESLAIKQFERLETWHRWFAWRPVGLAGTDITAWLEVVERKGTRWGQPKAWAWEYGKPG